MTHAAVPNTYLRTKIMTAKAEELRLMLFEGAIKFLRQSRDALVDQDYETMYLRIVRAQKIVLELNASLNHDVDPELTNQLAALYNYIYRRMIDANMERDVEAIDESIRLLDYERETWVMAIDKIQRAREAGEDPIAEAAAKIASQMPNENTANEAAVNGPIASIGEGKVVYHREGDEDQATPGGFSVEG